MNGKNVVWSGRNFMAMINRKHVEVDGAMARLRKTILHECDLLHIYLPRFCYHDELSIAGNCRMCLVETNSSAKPVIACATIFSSKLEVYTDSNIVKNARENVLEFLLINHPLDCPICDQGGECDLQDQTVIFGSDRGRFSEVKRSVEDKKFSFLIKAIMTRCIHCTRCIRFAEEVLEEPLLGTLGRGMYTEIGMFISDIFNSRLTGNIADICPVGALTISLTAYTSRAWELVGIDTIDVLDGMCSNIRVDVRGNAIIRVLPRVNSAVNGEWITDDIRTSYGLLLRDRLCFPMYRETPRSPFVRCSWQRAYHLMSMHVGIELSGNNRFAYFLGPGADVFSSALFKYLACASGRENVNPNFSVEIDGRTEFILDVSYAEENTVHLFFMIGVNPRTESPLFHLKLVRVFGTPRALEVQEGGGILFTGTGNLLNYKLQQYVFGSLLLEFLSYGSRFYCTRVKFADDCYYLKGESLSFFSETVNTATYQAYKLLEKKGIRINFLAKTATTVGVFEDAHGKLNRSKALFWPDSEEQPRTISFIPGRTNYLRNEGCIFLLTAQYFANKNNARLLHCSTRVISRARENTVDVMTCSSTVHRFCIYIGPYSYVAESIGANLVLPSKSCIEKTGRYLSNMGILQSSARAVCLSAPVWADEWIVLSLSLYLAKYHPRAYSVAIINRIFHRIKIKQLRYQKLPEQMPPHLLKKYYRLRRRFGLPERHSYDPIYEGDFFWPSKLDRAILEKRFLWQGFFMDTLTGQLVYLDYQRKVLRIYREWKNPDFKYPPRLSRSEWDAKWKSMTLDQRRRYIEARYYSISGDSFTLDDIINNTKRVYLSI